MTYPYEYIWEFPGIYSLSVTYGIYNSFYFSQYLGLGLIHFLEFRDHEYHKLKYAMGLTLLCMTMMLIFCRAQYSIDILGGFIFGHYFWMLAERWSWLIDYGLMKIPFHKRFPYFKSKCFMCKAPINKWATLLINNNGKITDDEMLSSRLNVGGSKQGGDGEEEKEF